MTSCIRRDGLGVLLFSGSALFGLWAAPVAAGTGVPSPDTGPLAQTIQAPVQMPAGGLRPSILPPELTQKPPVLSCEAQVRVIGEGSRQSAILGVTITNVGSTKAATGTRISYVVANIPTSNGFFHTAQDSFVLSNPLFPGERLVVSPFVPATAREGRYTCSAGQQRFLNLSPLP